MTEYTPEGVKGKYIIYRDKPLVRDKNVICYGDMDDDYILFMMILTTKKIELGNLKDKPEIPDDIIVQVLSTDTKKSSHERLVKQFEKKGLYEAFDIGLIWLDKLNKKK